MADDDNPQALFEAIGRELAATHQATTGKMFGVPILKINGKAFAGFHPDFMTFKLTGKEHKAALSLEGSKLFDPSGKNRPMKEWVQVSVAHVKVWHHYAEAALEYVEEIS